MQKNLSRNRIEVFGREVQLEKDLFSIKSTGVTTQPVVDAATAFLDVLNDDQRSRTTFPVDDIEWRSWDNRHFYKRRGVGFDEMDEHQKKHAFALLQCKSECERLKAVSRYYETQWNLS